MDELQTLRTRCGEMASEIERLNSVIVDLKQQITATDISWQNAKAVIDEANAQDPAWYKEVGTLEIEIPTRYRKRLETGSINPFDYEPFYARPIPAQQSPAVAVPDWYVVDRTDCDPKVFKRKEDALHFALASKSLIVAKETKVHPVFIGSQSPRITEQELREIDAFAVDDLSQSSAAIGSDDLVLIPRGLIGAACSAIDKKRDGGNLLLELRRYTTGDLSKQSPSVAVPSTLCKKLEIVSRRLEKDELWVLRDTVKLAIAALSSPRITEQELREWLNVTICLLDDYVPNPQPFTDIGRALLEKLNMPDSVGG